MSLRCPKPPLLPFVFFGVPRLSAVLVKVPKGDNLFVSAMGTQVPCGHGSKSRTPSEHPNSH